MARPFSSDAKLVVFGLVAEPDALPYGPDIGVWRHEVELWRMFPEFPGIRLVPLGLTPIHELEVPDEVESLVVAPVEPERFTDAKLKKVLKQTRDDERVRGLLLGGTRITPDVLYSLRERPWEVLDLSYCDELDGDELGALKLTALQSLRYLKLPCQVPAAFFQGLNLPRLQSLEILGVRGEPDVSDLFRNSPLEFFASGSPLTPKAIECLATGQLRGLSLSRHSTDDLPGLRGSIEALRVDYGTRPVEGFESLRHLQLGSLVGGTFRGLGAGLDALHSLALRGVAGSVERVGPLPDVPALILPGAALNEDDASLLEGLTRLEELSICCEEPGWRRPTPRLPLRALERLPAPEQLRRLGLKNLACRPGNEDVLAAFTSLELLSAVDVPLQLVDVVLEELTELRELQLVSTWITELAEHVTQPLRSLDLRATPISDEQHAALAAIPSLEMLALGERKRLESSHPPTGVDESEAPIPRCPDHTVLKAISGHPRLHTLSLLAHADVTEEEVVELVRSLPRLVGLDTTQYGAFTKAVGVKPPKLATEAQIKELRRMRREGLDEYEFFKACSAIWHDGLTIDDVAEMPRDEVARLLESLEGF